MSYSVDGKFVRVGYRARRLDQGYAFLLLSNADAANEREPLAALHAARGFGPQR
jgi:hypothetical protein